MSAPCSIMEPMPTATTRSAERPDVRSHLRHSSGRIVQLLIDHGADVNAIDRHTKTGDEGLTALDIARHNGDTPVVKLLLKAGAKPSQFTPVSLSMRRDNTIQRAVQDTIPHLQRADTNFITQLRLRLLPRQQPHRHDHGTLTQARLPDRRKN